MDGTFGKEGGLNETFRDGWNYGREKGWNGTLMRTEEERGEGTIRRI